MSKSTPLASSEASDNCVSTEERLLDAAVRCVEKYGVEKTFLDDIGKEANLSRRTVYRSFSSRKELLTKVALRSVAVFHDQVKELMRQYDSVADAFVIGAVETLYMARRDKVFMAILEAVGDDGLERYLLDPTGPAFAYTRDAWAETFARARENGEMRADATDDELTFILASANCIFLLRDRMTKEEQIHFMQKFLLPAILKSHALRAG